MALITCKECRASISDQAAQCPHCGIKLTPVAKTSSSTKFWGTIFAILVAVAVLSPSKKEVPAAPESSEQKAQKTVENTRFNKTARVVAAIQASLREPDSAKWETIQANDDGSVVCVKYRAKNGFGGVNLDRVSVVGGKASTETESWSMNCVGKNLYDMKDVLKAI